MSLKVGILLEWIKIFVPHGTRNLFWWVSIIVLVVNIGLYVAFVFVEIFACSPRQKIWNLILHGKCLDLGTVNVVSAIINLLSDIAILLLPQRAIWSLHMSLRKKIKVAPMFAVGIL
jgi:hypothetical protein